MSESAATKSTTTTQSNTFTPVVVKSAIREHYDPLAKLEETLRAEVLGPAGIDDVPRFSIRIGDGEHYTQGGRYAEAKDYTHGWKVVPIPEALFACKQDVAMALVLAAVNLKLDNRTGYLSRGVVELLRKTGIDTRNGNRYGAGREAQPYVVEDGLLARWIASSESVLDSIALIMPKKAAMPKLRPVTVQKTKRKPADASQERKLVAALDSVTTERNELVGKLDSVTADHAAAEAERNTLRDTRSQLEHRVSELEGKVHRLGELETENQQLKSELEQVTSERDQIAAERDDLALKLEATLKLQSDQIERARDVAVEPPPTSTKPPGPKRARKSKANTEPQPEA